MNKLDELIEVCASDLFSEHWNGARTWAEVTDTERAMYTRMAKLAAHHFAARLAEAEKVVVAVREYGINPCEQTWNAIGNALAAYPPKPASERTTQ